MSRCTLHQGHAVVRLTSKAELLCRSWKSATAALPSYIQGGTPKKALLILTLLDVRRASLAQVGGVAVVLFHGQRQSSSASPTAPHLTFLPCSCHKSSFPSEG